MASATAEKAPPQPPGQPEPPQPNPLLGFAFDRLHAAYRDHDFDAMSRQFLEVLDHLRAVTYYAMDVPTTHALNGFVKQLLYFFSQEDFVLSDAYASRFIDLNGVIANAVAMSEFGSTDPYVRILLGQQRNFTKLLALYNPRNRVKIDRRLLFATSPALATQWYFCFLEGYRNGCADTTTLENLREHVAYEDDRLIGINSFTHHAYFGATYIDHERDYLVKQRINRLFQSTPLCQRVVKNTPKSRTIGILTSMWFRRQSVYRSQQPFIEALAKDHELVLVHLGHDRGDLDTSLFKEVRRYDASKNADDLSAIDPNDFAMAYYPDIGMSIESIILANMRIAPIQVTNYGHPVSTFGSKIDYWIGGQETEAADRAREHYSERLVLMPGCAQAPVPLEYQLTYPKLPASPVIVDCTWSGQKINSDHLHRLKRIAERAKSPVEFRFFPGGAILGNGYIPLKRAIEGILGTERAKVMPDLGFEHYMPALEMAHFAIDAHPFGGYNTAVDLITLRKPIVTLAGNRFYNLSTAYLLRKVGLDELIATNEADFLDLCVRMIDDAEFRDRMIRRIK
ncbi:MAG: hypothetical protein EBZ74_08120, partial [Planctomycetia bacterium]|nr:hypothetical protein [Planctomycetia bacterium]